MRAILLLFIVLSFASCEQFLEVDLPDAGPRLVLNASLENTDTIRVFLSRSQHILERENFENPFPAERNARVVLKDEDGNEMVFNAIDESRPWEENYFYQLTGAKIIPGKKYEIVAEADGLPSVKSSQVFPENVPIQSLSFQDLGPEPSWPQNHIVEITLGFDDLPDRNYYEISGRYLGKDIQINNGDTLQFFYMGGLNPDPINPSLRKEHMWRRNVLLFQDVLIPRPNSEVVFRTSIPKGIDIDIFVNLAHVSEAYYRYLDTVELQDYNRGDILSQPVLVYNNIQGGMGIFKARNIASATIKVRID